MRENFLELTIFDIVTGFPATRDVFVHNGFAPFAEDTVLQQWGAMLKLKTALQAKHLDEQWFIRLLEEKMNEPELYGDVGQQQMGTKANRLNLLALLPCPLKVPVETELAGVIQEMREKKGISLNVCIESNADHSVRFLDYVKYFIDPEELPDILLITGFHFLLRSFVKRFVETGVFAAVPNQEVNTRLTSENLVDADGHFSVIAANALVMVVDTKRLGTLPLPTTWGDLLHPAYRGQVVIRGHEGTFCDIVQLNYFKDYGDEGIKRLAEAVRYGLHPAQMVKELTGKGADVPPIHVMPYFFARTLSGHSHVQVIWPTEGAFVYPILLLVKQEKMGELQDVAEFLTGPRIARICAGASFPAVHPAADWAVPAEGRLKWIGWDFVKNQDIEQFIQQLNTDFLVAHQAAVGTGEQVEG